MCVENCVKLKNLINYLKPTWNFPSQKPIYRLYGVKFSTARKPATICSSVKFHSSDEQEKAENSESLQILVVMCVLSAH